MYFKNFPKIYYDFVIGDTTVTKIVKDITLNVRVLKEAMDKVTAYEYYLIKDDETPEMIAERIYGDPQLHWTIMIVNEKYDYINDFPVNGIILDEMIDEKYGFDYTYDIDGITVLTKTSRKNQQHMLYGRPHYVDEDGNVVESDYATAIPITNYDYEFGLNEAKRPIKLVSPTLIGVFVENLRAAFKSNV